MSINTNANNAASNGDTLIYIKKNYTHTKIDVCWSRIRINFFYIIFSSNIQIGKVADVRDLFFSERIRTSWP